MFAGEIIGILESKAACLPGSRDLEGRPLVIVHVPTELQPWTKDNLDVTLRYFSSLFGQETRRRGLTVVVDGQKGSWRVARACIRHVGLSLGPDLANLVALRPDAFWDKQRVDNCTKIPKEGEPIYIPISRLHKYVDNSQLTEELGGTWAYNHSQWIQNRLYVEYYMKEAKNALLELDNFHQRLTEFTSSERLSTSTDPFVFSKQNFDTNKVIAQKVFQAGRELLNQIEKTDKECQRNNPNEYKTPQDALDTKEKIEKMLEVIETKQEVIDNAWIDMEKKCVDAREITVLETGVARVTKWILETAETMLNSQQGVGYDVPSSEELRVEHEALELQCRETYGQYAELLHKIDTLPQLNIKIPEDLKSQRDFMDFVCRSFATRLERRRNILITCLRFYRLVTEYFERTSEVFEKLVMCTDINSLESADCSLQELQESQTNIDFLAKELVKEGEKLSDMLSMPVKDALGRDVDVNYENDIVNVQEILEATLSRKQLFSDSVDLQKLTLEQVTHIHVYEKDAKQAVQWLNDLFQVMMKEYIHVGCSVREIQMMKEEHQAFQETAKGTYEYGCQLLNAALVLRHSCKLSEEYNVELTQNLWKAWKRLQNVGQEQMTRLRVSAVFHRSVEEHCKQLRELKASVQDLSKIEDLTKRKSKIRKFLQSRERLLLEVGRMVRLGRLLRTRLKEPVCEEQVHVNYLSHFLFVAFVFFYFLMGNALKSAAGYYYYGDGNKVGDKGGQESDSHAEDMSLNEGHLTSVEAITEKLNEVTNLAEQLDQALSNAQSSEGTSTPVTPNIKKILDGTASTTPEEWYSNLKSSSLKTPNTSSDSKSEDDFVTASECTCTPPSRSSSFQTASEGAISPWWELDAPSDSEGRARAESSLETVKRMVKSPVRITSEMTSDVQEDTESKNFKPPSESQGITSFVLENSTKLLRPDMTQTLPEPVGQPTESCVEEIVRNLSQIVKNNESLAQEETSEEKVDRSEVAKQPEYRYDGDTSSQYSLELLNADFNSCVPVQSHSKSHSFETDNTDMSLPKFHGDILSSAQPEIPRFDEQYKPEVRTHPRPFTRRDFSFPQNLITDESSKIYIIDASTPSPKSKRYVDSSLDSLEYYQQPIRKIVEAEIHQQEEQAKTVADLTEEEFTGKVKEVRDRRRPVITIDLQGACALPPDYYYQSQITKMAIKGVF